MRSFDREKMKSLLSCFLFVLAIWPFTALGRLSISPWATTLNRSGYQFKLTSDYFLSSSKVDSKGKETVFNGPSFSRWDHSATFVYGANSRLELQGGIRSRILESKIIPDDLREQVTGFSASGMESLWGGFRYNIPMTRRTLLTINTQVRKTLFSNDTELPETAETIILGDPGNEIEIGAGISYLSSRVASYSAYAGYRAPGNDLSREIHYLLEALWRKNNWGFILGSDGVFSLKNDPYTEVGERPFQKTGGTNLFNSLNREWLKPYISIRHAYSNNKIFHFKVAQTAHAVSSDKGMEFGFGITWGSQGITRGQQKIRTFKEYLAETTITKVSSKGNFVRIDAGLYSNIKKGMKFDIYQTNFSGDNKLMASGIAYKVGTNTSILLIKKLYRGKRVKKGFIARGY